MGGYPERVNPFFSPTRKPSAEEMEEIQINKIVRSRRRTIALVVTPDAKLIVRAPFHVPVSYIRNMVADKSVWIKKKLLEISKRPKCAVKEYVNDEEFLYLGRKYRLRIVENARANIELTECLELSSDILPRAEEAIRRWYRSEALRLIKERCARYATAMTCQPVSVRISEARRRWGSCGPKGTLNFSWRLIMAPPDIIDYVIVHELSHIGQLDHSRLYWDKVRNIMPDYKERENWLKDNEGLLNV